MTTLADIAAINRALRAAPFEPASPPASASNRRALWEALLRLVHQEIVEHGRAALVARPSAHDAQLYVEGAKGRLRGAFRDPLGLAQAMVDRGLGRVMFDNEGAAAQLDTVVIALLAGPFEAVPGFQAALSVFVCDDRFVDEVDEAGFPVLPGVIWERGAPPAARPAPLPSPERFAASVRGSRVEDVVQLLEAQVLPHVPPRELSPFLRAVMARARAFNEGDDDVESATTLWSACAMALPPGADRSRIVAIMRSIARRRCEGAERPPDVAGAVTIWQAVYRLGTSDDDQLRLVKSMMKVANLFTDLAGPWRSVDVPAAVQIWHGVWELHHTPGDDARVLRTMMDVANMLVDLRTPATIRVDPAITIWRGILALEPTREDRSRVIATMMDLARRLADHCDTEDDLQNALRLWEAVYQIEATPDGRLGVIKHMMAAANRRSQADQPRDQRDLPGAIAIWRSITQHSDDDEDRLVVTLTLMSVARAMVEAGEPWPAILLWSEAFLTSPDEHSRLRTVKSVMGLASSSPSFASQAAALLEDEGCALHSDFRAPVLAGLHYYARDYTSVIQLSDGSSDPAVRALAADALRKLGHIDRSIAQVDAVLDAIGPGASLTERDARISALCCRAYCRLEQARAGAEVLTLAIVDLEAAATLAKQAQLTVPPRVHTGLGYALRSQGREVEAEAAFAEALRLDAHNRKALQADSHSRDGALLVPTQRSIDMPTSGHVTLDSFEALARGCARADDLATLLRDQAGIGVPSAALEPYGRAVMARARQLNERDDDLESAITLWSACAEVQRSPEDHQRVLAVMRAVARKRAEIGDTHGAVHLLQAVHRVAREPDQCLAVIKSMMHVANLRTDLSGPWFEVDMDGAVALWRGAWQLHHSPDDDARVLRTMMSVASKLERPGDDMRARGEAARLLRQVVWELEGST